MDISFLDKGGGKFAARLRRVMADSFDKHRKILGKEKVDDFLAKFGLGPKYVPEEPEKYTCPKCGKGNAIWKELHPDTDMDCMALCCPDCGNEEEV